MPIKPMDIILFCEAVSAQLHLNNQNGLISAQVPIQLSSIHTMA
ncbi:MAG: hypothetical protein ACI9RO_000578 [Alteromonas macleodii]|jgi:hypothetical protein